MPSVKELEQEITNLRAQVSKLSSTNSNLRDDVVELQGNYSKLVEHVNTRFKAINSRFL
jgi:peptidoglycan hydrolase CwlO-like protein